MITSLDPITVTGNPGKAPTVKADWPIKIAKTTSKVLNAGSGRTVDASATINVNYVGINARTGKSFDSSFSRGSATSFSLDQVVTGFKKGLQGKKVGDRVLVMMPGTDAYDSQGGASQVGINKGDSLIFVVEIKGTSYKTAEGTAVTPAAGLPGVTVKKNIPEVKIGSAKKPASLVVQPLIKGEGRKVTAKDVIQVKYRTWSWADDDLIEDGYDGNGVSGQMSGVIEGWKKGLVGQPVGSRVMLIVPPDLAYPKGNSTPSIAKGDTLVYVIDILFADEASS
ncbi:FK506-binding protein [Acidipropionibacterium virtanenii]|uniref:Peptidyl-prolyl cis-trans isomerase n=2 Tax=Acidipropionibacterium virtanenii TaxID=2057246 RepID=A0A344UTH4_9ACTN|nr:FK506-binding protein [Acidipropionibacterium virtanenii]